MSSFQGDELYLNQDQIIAGMIAALQSAIPDVWLGQDGTLRIILEIESGQIEGLYLANQLLLQDMFIQTASLAGLQRFGTMLSVPQIVGTPAIGVLLFAGSGGTYIPIGTEVGFDPGGGGDVLYFLTTQDGTIPDPGVPTAPTVIDHGVGGNLTGTFEYLVSFDTNAGETLPGAISSAVILSASQAALSNIPLGGPGTISRNIYRSINGGVFQIVDTLSDNTTVVWVDNVLTPGTQVPTTVSTAEQVSLNAQSEQNGLDYNAVAGSITVLTSVPDGITTVTNPNPFAGGTDIEDIDTYRTRLLNWIRSPQTGSPQDLINWALTVPGVSTATCYVGDNLGVPTAGHVTIRIAGPNGSIPGADVIAATLALLQTKVLGNITIHVGTFTALPENITVTITPATGFLTATLTPSVQAAVTDYINSIPVGGTLYVSGIVQAIYGLAGINDVVVTLPVANITASSTQKFTAGTITVNGTP